MALITYSIDSERLDFATGVIEGAALAKPKLPDLAIDKHLESYGYQPMDILFARQKLASRIEEIKNPLPKEAPKKRGRQKKAISSETEKQLADKQAKYETAKAEYLAKEAANQPAYDKANAEYAESQKAKSDLGLNAIDVDSDDADDDLSLGV